MFEGKKTKMLAPMYVNVRVEFKKKKNMREKTKKTCEKKEYKKKRSTKKGVQKKGVQKNLKMSHKYVCPLIDTGILRYRD